MFKPWQKKSDSSGQVGVFVFLLAAILLLAFAWIRRQEIYDWARLRSYEAPERIAQLAFDTTMSNQARNLFYVHHPQLNDRSTFTENCADLGEHTIVLGCYVAYEGIYLFDVDDERLEGVEQVTAAHEMLHAAYDRLSDSEKSRVDDMTAQAFKGLSDERIRRTIENYRNRDPSVVPNELHSILATEVRKLPPELENYYSQYFTNRVKVVEYSEQYESILTSIRNQASSLELQISGLRNEIDQLEQTLAAERDALIGQRNGISTRQEARQYNARVDQYNENVNLLNNRINQHNELIEEYKEVALESEELYQALDSRPTL